jgi:hypothetical protein
MAGCSAEAAAALAAAPVKAAEAAVSFGEPAAGGCCISGVDTELTVTHKPCAWRSKLLLPRPAGAAADSGALRAIKAPGSSAPTLEFGAVQTQAAGRAADVRRRFTPGQQQQ